MGELYTPRAKGALIFLVGLSVLASLTCASANTGAKARMGGGDAGSYAASNFATFHSIHHKSSLLLPAMNVESTL